MEPTEPQYSTATKLAKIARVLFYFNASTFLARLNLNQIVKRLKKNDVKENEEHCTAA
jgi:hypothetical protein